MRLMLFIFYIVITVTGAFAQENTSLQTVADPVKAMVSAWQRDEATRTAAPTLVIATDEKAFLRAVSQWSETMQFPVLLWDPLFVQYFIDAYHPQSITWYTGGKEKLRKDIIDGPVGEVIPTFNQNLSHGLVVCPKGSSFTCAAVAAALGHRQHIYWLPPDKTFKRDVDGSVIDDLNTQLLAALNKANLPADKLFDQIDFLTISNDLPYYSYINDKSVSATDQLGRTVEKSLNKDVKTIVRNRWAFTGRLMGDAPTAVYEVMCSLFLTQHRGSGFNSYIRSNYQPWISYDTAPAIEAFKKSGLEGTNYCGSDYHQIDDIPLYYHDLSPNSDTDILFINSLGSKWGWAQDGGPGGVNELPYGHATFLYMIHSFSAETPEIPDTLIGRWLQVNGGFGALASQNEPNLQAFGKAPDIAEGMLSGEPFAMAVRHNRWNEPVWMLTYFGDPQTCLRRQPLPNAAKQRIPGKILHETDRQKKLTSASEVRLLLTVKAWDWKSFQHEVQTQKEPNYRTRVFMNLGVCSFFHEALKMKNQSLASESMTLNVSIGGSTIDWQIPNMMMSFYRQKPYAEFQSFIDELQNKTKDKPELQKNISGASENAYIIWLASQPDLTTGQLKELETKFVAKAKGKAWFIIGVMPTLHETAIAFFRAGLTKQDISKRLIEPLGNNDWDQREFNNLIKLIESTLPPQP